MLSDHPIGWHTNSATKPGRVIYRPLVDRLGSPGENLRLSSREVYYLLHKQYWIMR